MLFECMSASSSSAHDLLLEITDFTLLLILTTELLLLT